jgi:hypothetical protein
MLNNKWFLIVFTSLFVLVTNNVSLAQPATRRLDYDRIEQLQQFTDAIYADLKNKVARFDTEATFEQNGQVVLRAFTLQPCEPHIVTPQVGGPISYFPGQTKTEDAVAQVPPTLPSCNGVPDAKMPPFLRVSFDLGGGYHGRPIFKYVASGTYIDGRLTELRNQFTDKPNATEAGALEALSARSPKYGPDKKKEFLSILPLEKIRILTGCRLRPATAGFTVKPIHESETPDFQWVITGSSPGIGTLGPAQCYAAFEPFEGRLTLFVD